LANPTIEVSSPKVVRVTKGRHFRWLTDKLLVNLFLWPTFLLLIFITVFPLVWSLYLSFTSYSPKRDAVWTAAPWVGFQNYAQLLADKQIWARFTTSAAVVVPTVMFEFFLGFGVAFLFSRQFKGRSFITTAILIPMMLSTVVVGLFWRFMLQADIGIVNYFIRDVFRLPTILWLTDTRAALAALVLVDAWQWTPFVFLISLAGLSAVPKYLYEAADVDRASDWFKFRHITLPLISPLLLIAIIFRLMDTYKLFDLVWVLTNGGGSTNTKVVPSYLYEVAFGNLDIGKASALGYIMLVVIIALANILIRVLNQVKSRPEN
jgi:multiple sugar transport system permease protein